MPNFENMGNPFDHKAGITPKKVVPDFPGLGDEFLSARDAEQLKNLFKNKGGKIQAIQALQTFQPTF